MDEQQIDLTPMLDVVFIMLIFFIVTATFIKLPGATVEKTSADNALPLKPAMLVAITENSKIFINREEVDPRFLRTRIAALAADNPQGALVVQTDREADIEQMVMVVDAAKEVGITGIHISAEER